MASPNIVIVDYQAGNLRSVQKALERSGAQATISSDQRVIQDADALVFPGQGACDSSMRHLRERGLVEPIKAFIRSGRPFFGVCLGLQLLLEGSDEGIEPGLGILKGRVRRLPEGLKIPHMGWNQVRLLKRHPVLDGVPDGSNFYFVHSYYADPDDRSAVAGVTSYGIEFCSVAARENIIAVQFHPEKSGETGLRLYENFVRLTASARTQAAWR
jgi:glutamine amidotransferase